MTIRNLDALFRPARVVVLGKAVGDTAQALLDNLRRTAPPGLVCSLDELAGAPAMAAAVVADPAAADPAQLQRLHALGGRALIWPHACPPGEALMAQARAQRMRVLGPRSPGVLHPPRQLALSALPPATRSGTLALIVQSQSVASAALDWAAGRRIGFSWIAVTGGESDVDIADLLDYAALDRDTHAVAVEAGRIRAGRKFMSAARACARAKPVAVLQTQLDVEPVNGADAVRSAAFARAGMVECRSLPALFDAIAALHRLPPLQRARALIAGNGAGICALAVDAVLREGLQCADPAAATWACAQSHVPGMRRLAGAADLGEPPAAATVAALQAFLGDAGVDLVIFIRSPMAAVPHEAVAEALAQARFDQRLLTVWLGLETALAARRISADAELATFTSPDAAARAVRYRWEYARNRELLTQTPPHGPATGAPTAELDAWLRHCLQQGLHELRGADALRLLTPYGIDGGHPSRGDDLRLTVSVRRHPELGMYLRAAPLMPGFTAPAGYGFMPLDALLARRLLADAGLCAESAPAAAALQPVADLLERVGQMVIEQPHVAELDLCVVARGSRAWCSRRDARLRLCAEPPPERQRLALAPYPATLSHIVERDGQRLLVRPVRPDDEPALIGLLEGLDMETVRLRFFTYIRHFNHSMALRMTQIDYDRELALVIVPLDSPERIDGIGTLAADPDGAAAEFAVLVDPQRYRSGLGRHLLEQLLEHARRTGIGRVFGEVLADNTAMLRLARRLGFTCRAVIDDPGVMHVEIDT
ncbi:MAG: bifunctional acetate--CoA ligase family protein/GNAT family N-acetyltransferase, partial [Nevskia sp.]|nr:bifunctional acetate--CoA ligase family protein/GNAT family N-acetyltransferase [Nevskia sp.]